jgi:hypothetical protein
LIDNAPAKLKLAAMKPFSIVLAGALVVNVAAADSNVIFRLKPVEQPLPPLDSVNVAYRRTNITGGVKREFQIIRTRYDSVVPLRWKDMTPVPRHGGSEAAERANSLIIDDYRLRFESSPASPVTPTLKPSAVENVLSRP